MRRNTLRLFPLLLALAAAAPVAAAQSGPAPDPAAGTLQPSAALAAVILTIMVLNREALDDRAADAQAPAARSSSAFGVGRPCTRQKRRQPTASPRIGPERAATSSG